MTVAVRSIATRDLGPVNALRVVMRESWVGLINGVLFAILMGLFAWWWFGSNGLGGVIGAAMIINMLAAALAGILVPLSLDHFDIDPAVSSGGVCHHGDRCGRIFRLPRAGCAVAHLTWLAPALEHCSETCFRY